MRKKNILVCDDDKPVSESIKLALEDYYNVDTVHSANELLDAIQKKKPGMLILDLNLPDIDGFEVCRVLRKDNRYFDLPIIMLTGAIEKTERKYGLEDIGADYYIGKPYEVDEFCSHVKALFRRVELDRAHKKAFEIGGICVDEERHEMSVYGKIIDLTENEFKLMVIFIKNPGIILSEKFLYDMLEIKKAEYDDRSLDMLIHRLKSKLESRRISCRIENVEGEGYRFNLPK